MLQDEYTYIFLGVILVALIIVMYLLDNKHKKEHFVSTSSQQFKQTFTTHLDNVGSLLPVYSQEVPIEFMRSMIHVLERGTKIPDNWQGTSLCIDTVDLERVSKGNSGTNKKLKSEGYFIRLIHRERKDELKDARNISNLRIGVFDICEEHLVKAIAYGYRLPNVKPIVNVMFIPNKQRSDLNRLLQGSYDVIYAYIIPGSKFEKDIYSQEVCLAGFDGIDTSRINISYPYVAMKKTYMSSLYDWKKGEVPKAIYSKDGTMELLWASQHLFTIGDPKSTISGSSGVETFITQLTVSDEMSDPAYRCYGELTNENRALCNSTYDAWGKPKKEPTYWDIPCTENAECPFYKANKNFPNERGMCMPTGLCELPVGIKRMAYVKYRDDFPYTPFCYGCDPRIIDCCKDQEDNPKKYPKLVSPDYAFENDIMLRAPRGLQTVIPLQ